MFNEPTRDRFKQFILYLVKTVTLNSETSTNPNYPLEEFKLKALFFISREQ